MLQKKLRRRRRLLRGRRRAAIPTEPQRATTNAGRRSLLSSSKPLRWCVRPARALLCSMNRQPKGLTPQFRRFRENGFAGGSRSGCCQVAWLGLQSCWAWPFSGSGKTTPKPLSDPFRRQRAVRTVRPVRRRRIRRPFGRRKRRCRRTRATSGPEPLGPTRSPHPKRPNQPFRFAHPRRRKKRQQFRCQRPPV